MAAQNGTIAAISTALMPAGIGVVRISGTGAVAVAEQIWRPKRGAPLSGRAANTAAVGVVSFGGRDIDECIVTIFRAPHSYTGEDVVELSCHGGVYIVRRLLEAALAAGARLAQPGEFTKRAFLNGKLDLTRAEAVMDLIGAQGETAARAALAQHEGALYRSIQQIKAVLVEISADIAAWIDFPDEGVPSLEPEALTKSLEKTDGSLRQLSENFGRGRIVREGIETAIVGRPNVGKSTLMNALAGCEKSIVTDIPGTTRDVVEEQVSFAGVTLRLWDTAGLRETNDPVENAGVARAKKRLCEAQLVFALFDGASSFDAEDQALLDLVRKKKVIAVVNKCDLPVKIDRQSIEKSIGHVVYISAARGEGLAQLEEAVRALAGTAGFDPGAALIANERQLDCVRRAGEGVKLALDALESGLTLDAVSVGIADALSALCELTGERVSEQVIDRVFEKFCIGK
jgi:tRNA modification GTPase TrmE